jgi:hypothetical protein
MFGSYLEDDSFFFRSDILEYVWQKNVSKSFYSRGAFQFCHPGSKTFVYFFANKTRRCNEMKIRALHIKFEIGTDLWVTFDSFLGAVHIREFFMI